ncbi:unnamed protein product [Orchesella dallaii]|uniref:Uncharacterized protein n=1 Tax=Orchesella dallaii TaxID=48710 RepID=A0ABP1RNQ6_9HEXA
MSIINFKGIFKRGKIYAKDDSRDLPMLLIVRLTLPAVDNASSTTSRDQAAGAANRPAFEVEQGTSTGAETTGRVQPAASANSEVMSLTGSGTTIRDRKAAAASRSVFEVEQFTSTGAETTVRVQKAASANSEVMSLTGSGTTVRDRRAAAARWSDYDDYSSSLEEGKIFSSSKEEHERALREQLIYTASRKWEFPFNGPWYRTPHPAVAPRNPKGEFFELGRFLADTSLNEDEKTSPRKKVEGEIQVEGVSDETDIHYSLLWWSNPIPDVTSP